VRLKYCSFSSALEDLLLLLQLLTDGGMMAMKSVPAMHNGVFPGDFPPARYISIVSEIK